MVEIHQIMMAIRWMMEMLTIMPTRMPHSRMMKRIMPMIHTVKADVAANGDDVVQADDGNANYYTCDDAAQVDDGAASSDDDVQADDGNANNDAYNDATTMDDAGQYYQDAAAQIHDSER